MAPIDRSKTPADSANVSPIATIVVTACSLARVVHVVLVRKRSGIVTAKTTNMMPNR